MRYTGIVTVTLTDPDTGQPLIDRATVTVEAASEAEAIEALRALGTQSACIVRRVHARAIRQAEVRLQAHQQFTE